MVEERKHSLSPSAWNRYETCPRMYWLSRQGLPRKAGMAASLGTAVHASIEDLLQIELTGRPPAESNWLLGEADVLLRKRWEEEKQIFHDTPRHPNWKEGKYSEAQKQQKGAINMLLEHVGVQGLAHDRVTIALWKKIQSLVIAVEGELVTKDGQLMGRLDLLLADVDDSGNLRGWLVADLKTGKPPQGKLKPEVNRQLRMYRDILLSNNEKAPPVQAQGWYTDTSSKWDAVGENVLEAAYEAWNATQPSDTPLEPTPGKSSCGGFCDWKAWCPHWWNWRHQNKSLHKGDFADGVVILHQYDEGRSTAIIEECVPKNALGGVEPTGQMRNVTFDGRGKEVLEALLDDGHQGPIFLGSAMMNREVWRVGPWCDVLPWNPIPDSGRL